MKRTYALTTLRYVLFIWALALIALPLKADRSAHHPPVLRDEKAVEYLKRDGLYASLGEAVRRARYGVKWVERTTLPGKEAAYAAGNPLQHFHSHFTPDGLHLGDSTQAEKAWQIDVKLRSVGYGTRQRSVSAGQLTATGDRIEYTRSVASGQWQRTTHSGQRTDH